MTNREIDALIAQKIMGWKTWHFKNPSRTPGVVAFEYDTLVPPEYDGSDLQHLDMLIPHYSSDIAAAWQIIDKLSNKYRVSVHHFATIPLWQCSLEIKDGNPRYPGMSLAHSGDEFANHESPAMAICLVALKTVGIKAEAL